MKPPRLSPAQLRFFRERFVELDIPEPIAAKFFEPFHLNRPKRGRRMKAKHDQVNVRRALAIDYLKSQIGDMTDAEATKHAIALSRTAASDRHINWPQEIISLFPIGDHASSISKGRRVLKRLAISSARVGAKSKVHVKGYVLTDVNGDSKKVVNKSS